MVPLFIQTTTRISWIAKFSSHNIPVVSDQDHTLANVEGVQQCVEVACTLHKMVTSRH
jgi:hypothetical protein